LRTYYYNTYPENEKPLQAGGSVSMRFAVVMIEVVAALLLTQEMRLVITVLIAGSSVVGNLADILVKK